MAARIDEQRFCLDMLTVALGRMGYGEKRLADFEKQFSAAYIEYDKLQEERFEKHASQYNLFID